ncbi:hypothetical protein AOC36_04175 [Erysipelothrix larvae]|uniref:Phosphatidate cytidylyltransferase n=1 Tax=Erysipelothrix larvae TaxID=1514105 RepID=A0A120JTK7_9FIRM|nr:phosphatidate cytidylyltransferase [Erysipelothrix larvae]AMC93196.1 hypothetical protein AOC36_04175 [Erysipelothrix larvae]
MKERIITSIILVGVLALVLISGQTGFMVFVAIVGVIAGYEIYKIKKTEWKPSILLILWAYILSGAFLPTDYFIAVLSIALILLLAISVFNEWFSVQDMAFVFMMGTILALTLSSLVLVFSYDLFVLLYVVLATYSTDIFAYFGGTFFGKTKLIERVSPKKTVEGAIIGVIGSITVSLLFGMVYVVNRGILPFEVILTISLLVPFVGQIGDLAFSLVKRFYNIKDYGNILPGHGGILDRIDSIAFSFIVFTVVLSIIL